MERSGAALFLASLLLLGGLPGAGYRSLPSAEAAQKAAPAAGNAWEMPAFRLQGLDGAWHRLDEWRGRVILLNFWASWCAPCQYEIRELVGYQSRLGGRGLQILGLGVDEPRRLKNVARTLGINYPVLIADPTGNGKLMRQWGNRTGVIPYNVVIARDGRIAFVHRGPLDRETFERRILPLLDGGIDD